MSPELTKLLRDFLDNDPMKCVIVSSDSEMETAIEAQKKDGRRLAAVSNAGLASPFRRLTFLPTDAFTDEPR